MLLHATGHILASVGADTRVIQGYLSHRVPAHGTLLVHCEPAVRRAVAPMTNGESERNLDAARERGLGLIDRWVFEGVLVDAVEASCRHPGVVDADSDEVVAITHRENRLYLAGVLDLPPTTVARVNRALGAVTSAQRLLWWMRGNGGLGGITPTEAIRNGRVRRCVELARGYAAEHSREVYSDHQRLDARSLAIHRALALSLDAVLVQRARELLERWRLQSPLSPAVFDEWSRILERPLEEIEKVLLSTSERATRLRQSSPFAPLLSAADRERIYASFPWDE